MARSLRTLVAVAVCGAIAGCAHAPAGGLALASADGGLPLPDLGEDLPGGAEATTPSARLFSIDTPVGALCGHPDARAVIERDLPGLTARPEFVFFKRMTLRQLQAASGGRMSVAQLARVSSDLEALGAAAPPLMAVSAALP